MQVYEHMAIYNFITPNQFGFQCNRPSQQCTVNFMNTIRMNLDQRKCKDVVYMDLRKAFDTATHTWQYRQLLNSGLCKARLEWLTDYLFHQKQKVKTYEYVSDAQSITYEVPQGSINNMLC